MTGGEHDDVREFARAERAREHVQAVRARERMRAECGRTEQLEPAADADLRQGIGVRRRNRQLGAGIGGSW